MEKLTKVSDMFILRDEYTVDRKKYSIKFSTYAEAILQNTCADIAVLTIICILNDSLFNQCPKDFYPKAAYEVYESLMHGKPPVKSERACQVGLSVYNLVIKTYYKAIRDSHRSMPSADDYDKALIGIWYDFEKEQREAETKRQKQLVEIEQYKEDQRQRQREKVVAEIQQRKHDDEIDSKEFFRGLVFGFGMITTFALYITGSPVWAVVCLFFTFWVYSEVLKP